MNYKNAKIYKLTGENGLYYYGSTTRRLNIRLNEHRCKSGCERSKLLTNPTIELLENYPCNNKIELQERERWYIENNECVNRKVPNRTDKEYQEKYRKRDTEKKKEKKHNKNEKSVKSKKKYRELNKAKEKAQQDIYRNRPEIKEYEKQYKKFKNSFFGKLCKIF